MYKGKKIYYRGGRERAHNIILYIIVTWKKVSFKNLFRLLRHRDRGEQHSLCGRYNEEQVPEQEEERRRRDDGCSQVCIQVQSIYYAVTNNWLHLFSANGSCWPCARETVKICTSSIVQVAVVNLGSAGYPRNPPLPPPPLPPRRRRRCPLPRLLRPTKTERGL